MVQKVAKASADNMVFANGFKPTAERGFMDTLDYSYVLSIQQAPPETVWCFSVLELVWVIFLRPWTPKRLFWEPARFGSALAGAGDGEGVQRLRGCTESEKGVPSKDFPLLRWCQTSSNWTSGILGCFFEEFTSLEGQVCECKTYERRCPALQVLYQRRKILLASSTFLLWPPPKRPKGQKHGERGLEDPQESLQEWFCCPYISEWM